VELRKFSKEKFPDLLAPLLEIPKSPEHLYLRGTIPQEGTVLIAVVGSRKYSPYGKEACEHLIRGLAGYPVAIVSGLALGLDSIAHRAALDAKIPTIAIPGSGLSDAAIYPRSHAYLAKEIVEQGGALLSEYEPDFKATLWSFPKRNRLIAGLARLVLIVEAEMRSGALITARLALDFGKDVAVVPGSIFSDGSKGTHYLLRHGAAPVTGPDDILELLGFEYETRNPDVALEGASSEELLILETLSEPKSREELSEALSIPISALGVALSMLEIKGAIIEEGGKVRKR